MKRERCSRPPTLPWGPHWHSVSPPHPHLRWAAAGLPAARRGSSLHVDTRPCGSFEWLCRGARGSPTVFLMGACFLAACLRWCRISQGTEFIPGQKQSYEVGGYVLFRFSQALPMGL